MLIDLGSLSALKNKDTANNVIYSKKPFKSNDDYRILEEDRENIHSEEDLIRDLSQNLTVEERKISNNAATKRGRGS